MTIKNRISLVIIAIVIIIAVVLLYLWISGIFAPMGTAVEKPEENYPQDLTFTNSGLRQFPPEIQGDIQSLARKYSISLNYWRFDPYNNEIDLFTYGFHNMSAIQGLEGKQIRNYTIQVFNDKESERTEAEVFTFVAQLKKNPDYQIDDFGMVTSPYGPYIELWCIRLTPENGKLDDTVIKGWKILVYPMSPLPHTVRLPKTNSSNISP